MTLQKIQSADEGLQSLVKDYITTKQNSLLQMKKGIISKDDFLKEAESHMRSRYIAEEYMLREIIDSFQQYIFGYSRLSPLIDDEEVSDIRVVGFDCIRIKKNGARLDSDISFSSEKEYRQFIDYIATKNQVNISNLNAIQRFTDTESHPDFILRFTISMPIVNTFNQPYLCIRKVPKKFPVVKELITKNMLKQETAELLIGRLRQGSMLISGGNSSGKTTLLNALKETIPDNCAVLVAQQADELTTRYHPDMMFLHSLPKTSESAVSYDLKDISIAGLTMDVDYFIIGEVKGDEALYLLNAAYTGQICAATIHAPSADKSVYKLVDYAMYDSRYSRDELMKMMDCFKTLVFMENFKVKEIFNCSGWDDIRKELKLERIF
ncbi:MAG: Flp pilus assembly complex ATPase component TadA [Lachnospiraceae bacterium]|nr:Flp pilus assembly complex ATPase component TadA [Lachnospiraceae bacterium]